MEILFHMSGRKLINFILPVFFFFFGFTIPLNLFLQLRNFLIYSIQFNIQDTTRNFINISIQPNDTHKTLIFITKSHYGVDKFTAQVKLKRDNHNGSRGLIYSFCNISFILICPSFFSKLLQHPQRYIILGRGPKKGKY